jgi:hypothetical protein
VDKKMTKGDKKVLNDVRRYGWHVISVMEEDDCPPFTFSIGLYHSFRHPEILIIGLDLTLMQSMINNIGNDIKSGKVYRKGKYYSGLLEGFDCLFRKVAEKHYDEYLGYANWFYRKKAFPVLQCVWPTTKGVFPWEKEFPKDLITWQPLLQH